MNPSWTELEQLQYERRMLFRADAKMEEALRATIELRFSDNMQASIWRIRNEIKARVENVNKWIEEREHAQKTDQG